MTVSKTTPGNNGTRGPCNNSGRRVSAWALTMLFCVTCCLAVDSNAYVVNSTGDALDLAPGNGVCDTDALNSQGAAECTLRAAIEEANALAGSDIIDFNIPVTEAGYSEAPLSYTIQPGSALPTVSEQVAVDGSTQPDFQGTPIIVVNGVSADVAVGLVLAGGSDGSTIRGLIINSFDGREIQLRSSNNNTVGGTAADDRNVFSGNTPEGINARGDNNVIIGNYIGTDKSGSVAGVGNASNGIRLSQGVDGNTIGGTTAAARNIIAGNTSADVAADVRRELVLVDAGIANHEQLVADLLEGRNQEDASLEVFVLDGQRDGVEQIAAALAGHSDIDAIHLIAHGSQAELRLGTARLTLDSMIGEYADELAEIDQALTNSADILVYGCNFGRGALGRQAATRLADLTGADIAASDDLTGARELGGDWDLEYATGSIEASVAFSTQLQQDWSVLLALNVYYLDGVGDGSDVPTAALKAAVPTDTSFPVPNYDPGRNADTGLTVSKGGQDSGEGDPTKHQLWIVSAGGIVLDGPATLTLWSAMLNFLTDKAGEVTAFLVETDADGSNLSELARATATRGPWNPAGTWVEDTFNFGNVSTTIGSGRYLGVKIIVTDNSETDMWFAYDTTSYDSRLEFTDDTPVVPVLVKRAFETDGTPIPTG